MTQIKQRHGLALLVALAVLCPRPAYGQGGFREHAVGFGIRISLPATWDLVPDSELTRGRQLTLEQMKASGVQELRQIAANSQNAPLFRAHDRRVRANSANLNVTVAPDNERSSFETLATSEIAGLVAELYRIFEAQVSDAGGSAKCLSHEIVTVEKRKVLVIQQEAKVPTAGLANRRTVVLLPARGLLFTLSISLTRADYDPATSRAIVASIRLPS